jgi:hypothetical protein
MQLLWYVNIIINYHHHLLVSVYQSSGCCQPSHTGTVRTAKSYSSKLTRMQHPGSSHSPQDLMPGVWRGRSQDSSSRGDRKQ